MIIKYYRILLLLLFTILQAKTIFCLSKSLCLQSTPKISLPILNTQLSFTKLPYLTAVHPKDVFEKGVEANTKINFLLVQQNNYNSINFNNSICNDEILEFSSNRLNEIIMDSNNNFNALQFVNQSQLYSYLTIMGLNIAKTSRYYNLIKMSNLYVKELKANARENELNIISYWFQFIPPLPASYEIKLFIDFINCKASLQSYFTLENRDSGIEYDSNFCIPIYDYSLSLLINVNNSNKEISKEINNNCDLSDLSSSYWIYPPVSTLTSLSQYVRANQPTIHIPTCPTYYNRLKRATVIKRRSDRIALYMLGDSNTIRSCNVIKKQVNPVPKISVCAKQSEMNVLDTTDLSKYNTHDRKNNIKKNIKKCYESSFACTINPGHHAPTMNSNEFILQYEDILFNSFQPRNNNKSTPLIASSSIASLVSVLNHKDYNQSFHFQSNVYREALNNYKLQQSIINNKEFKDIFYIDIFHPSFMLGKFTKTQNDPVHFNNEYYWFHTFILEILLVSFDCFKYKDCNTNSNSFNEYTNYLINNWKDALISDIRFQISPIDRDDYPHDFVSDLKVLMPTLIDNAKKFRIVL